MTPSFYQLDDDTLSTIVKYLPMADRIKVERVNKRWRTLVLKSFRQVKILEVHWDFEKRKIQIPEMREILWRCGENLTHLNLEYLYEIKPRCAFTLINKYCKSLQHLDVSTLVFQENDLNMLSKKIIENLKSLRMDDCNLEDSEMLESFLDKAVKLEQFSASRNNFLYGESLLDLSQTVKSLDISDCCKFYDNTVINIVLADLPNLETLNISNTHLWPANLCEVCHQLKSLNMSSMKEFFEDADDSFLDLSFERLEDLDASDQWVNDGFIPFIVNKCPELRKLNLYGVYTADSAKADVAAFKCLKDLKNLVHLIISSSNFNNEVIEYWISQNFKFKHLECADCSITQAGLTKLIQNMPELELLHFDLQPKFDITEFVEAAFKAVKL